MIATVFGWIAFAVLILAVLGAIYLYFLARSVSNKIMQTSKDNFFAAANSLLETPNELPDSVLSSLEMMIASGNDQSSHWKLLRAVRSRKAKERVASGHRPTIQLEVESLRPELSELYVTAMVSWLGFLTHKNVYTALWIQVSILRLRGKGLDQGRAEVETSKILLGGVGAGYC